MRKNKNKIILFVIFLIALFLVMIKFNIKQNIDSIMLKVKIDMYGDPISEDETINNCFFKIDSSGNLETKEGINEAIEYANKNNIKYIKLEKGTYLIDGQSHMNANESDEKKGIILKSNITIDLNGSRVIQKANSKVNSAVFTITEVENVCIKNGLVIGDRERHDYSVNSTHEWGFGIDIRGSKNITVENMEISQCTGDGIFITNCQKKSSENILILGNNISSCRRQGISIIDGNQITIEDNEIYNINGTNPQSGIDLESWDSNQTINNVYIRKNKIYNNKSNYNIIVMGMSKNVYIQNNELYGKLSCDNIKEKIIVERNIIKNGTASFLVNNEGLVQGKIINKVIFRENKLENSNLYMLNVENALVEENCIKNNKILIFNSNLGIANNKIVNEGSNISIGMKYSLYNMINAERKYKIYMYNNKFEGNYNTNIVVDTSKNIIVHNDEIEFEKYKSEYE